MASLTFQLIMRSGPTPGKSYDLIKGEVYIGRDIHNDIVINDAEVSRKHARLVVQAGGYVLEDLGSTNGTFVNGQRLMGPHVLRPNELIMLGENVGLVFETSYDAGATVVASAPPSSQPAVPTTYQPPAQQAYIPAARSEDVSPTPPPQPTYGEQPPSPAEPYYEPLPEEKRSNRTLLLAGCGCLVVILCVIVASGFAFDQLNLYCVTPFDTVTNMFTNLLLGGAACQ